MALHGEIKVNGHEVGNWYARRLHIDVRTVCDYEYEVRWTTLEGDDRMTRGTLRWPYGSAVDLAAEILSRAAMEDR